MTEQRIDFAELSETLKKQRLDGWLLFDFHDVNPIARRVVAYDGMVTRRVFVLLPAVGSPHALVHTLDHYAFREFPGTVETYVRWTELHQRLGALVRGRRLAMEVSPEDAVPYLDRVPSGVVELLSRLGATIVPSAPLVTRFAARWSAQELQQHRAVAESLAEIARTTLGRVVGEVGTAREVEVQQRVIEAIQRAGWTLDESPIVAFGAHAADPHFSPGAEGNATLVAGEVVLIDLWARHSPEGMWADQTWMGVAANTPSDEVARVWEAVQDARDAVVDRLRQVSDRAPVTGADLDRVARDLLTARGYGEAFGHRTGHSIDFDLHGSGPHLDDLETHDVRELIPGVGFSIEPGVYLSGRFGVRSEVNAYLSGEGPVVTPSRPQRDLITPS